MGKVIDNHGRALANVSVICKNTNDTILTNDSGGFVQPISGLNNSENIILVFQKLHYTVVEYHSMLTKLPDSLEVGLTFICSRASNCIFFKSPATIVCCGSCPPEYKSVSLKMFHLPDSIIEPTKKPELKKQTGCCGCTEFTIITESRIYPAFHGRGVFCKWMDFNDEDNFNPIDTDYMIK